MSDSIEEIARKLNEQDPIDIDSLVKAFDQVFYKTPKGEDPVEAEHVQGVCLNSTGSVEELIEKLEAAKEAHPKFVRIGEREYNCESPGSLSRLIDGIRIGTSHER